VTSDSFKGELMIYDVKKMDLYRIIVDEINIDTISSAIRGVMGFIPTLNADETSLINGNIESINISEQVECTLEAHHGTWPDYHPVYFSKRCDNEIKMEIAWFRFVLNRKG
jgi:hypothetical protein